MFRGLGFEPVSDKDGVAQKMLISEFVLILAGASAHGYSGSSSGDVHTVTFDRKKSTEEYANVLWDLTST